MRWLHRLSRYPLRALGLLALGLAVVAVSALAWRAYDAFYGAPLALHHTFAPDELSAAEIDRADWVAWLAQEDRIFAAVRREVTDRLEPADRTPENRYHAGSPMFSPRFATDWNRSQVMVPDGDIRGAVVILHGLTDAPYSGRHIAKLYQARGFVAVMPRLPGHGTVPAGLAVADRLQWIAAARLAIREAKRLSGTNAPLHIVGFSNGGALAVAYALQALDNKDLPQPDQVVLLSPMIGVTAFARFAGVAAWPALFPAFTRAAWLGTLPEFNPFKYNSFPVNGAVQARRLSVEVQASVAERARTGRLARLAPVLTFQSVVDSTVSARAVTDGLYRHLPNNGSELVLYDINRAARLQPLFRAAADAASDRLVPPAPRAWRSTILANRDIGVTEIVERSTPAGSTVEETRPTDLAYPRDVFSLSHVALPFPLSDGLYGTEPDPADGFGATLGNLSSRGETGVLVVGLDLFARLTSNPFFSYQARRIDEVIGPRRP
jgi:alpha-beta hydrolase superfamily lysophospholipase